MEVAVVTGGNKGIGKEIVRGLALAGMTVVLGSRDIDRGRWAAQDLRDAGDVRAIQLDVTDETSTALAAAYLRREFGRLDVLVNNAAVVGRVRPPTEVTAADVRPVYETNVVGVVGVTHAMLPLLHRAPAGRIVNVSSTRGSLAHATAPTADYDIHLAYHSSKSAVNMLTVLYARALRDSTIRVYAVCPGRCATDLNGNAGERTPRQGAAIAIRVAITPDEYADGGFVDDGGPIDW
jgi:NAD(P)-dependent dehydrogenase (short-subunit alcohol dehydrogenase family)